MVGEEIKDSPILLNVGLWIGFESMDHVGELQAITNKEDRKVVSDEVEVTLQVIMDRGRDIYIS